MSKIVLKFEINNYVHHVLSDYTYKVFSVVYDDKLLYHHPFKVEDGKVYDNCYLDRSGKWFEQHDKLKLKLIEADKIIKGEMNETIDSTQ